MGASSFHPEALPSRSFFAPQKRLQLSFVLITHRRFPTTPSLSSQTQRDNAHYGGRPQA